MNGTRKSVRLFGENLDEGMHICTFFRTSAEKYRVLMPFIREGMEQGDRAFHIVNPSLRSEHAQRIAEAGIDTTRAEVEGQLEIMGWDEAYLRGGSFNHSAMLSLLPVLLNDGRTRGFPITRFIADMAWVLNDPGAMDRLLEYECRVNLALPKAGDIVICSYDLDKFGAGDRHRCPADTSDRAHRRNRPAQSFLCSARGIVERTERTRVPRNRTDCLSLKH